MVKESVDSRFYTQASPASERPSANRGYELPKNLEIQCYCAYTFTPSDTGRQPCSTIRLRTFCVMRFLGHKNINNTLLYVQLEEALFGKEPMSSSVKWLRLWGLHGKASAVREKFPFNTKHLRIVRILNVLAKD